ncbi:MAG: hypothetical protein C0622_04750 [Desulfuromonas sp.]|nr:MAG: hypothetical protein C0622_04750 [Desulfuromonas sp.]
MRFLFFLILFLLPFQPVFAAVDVALRGQNPVHLEDVYQQDSNIYVAVDDVLPAVGLSGYWDSIAHSFRIKTSRGWALISPASSYLKIADNFYPLQDKPRFIDGRLRVTESFIVNQLSLLTGRSIYFRNLDPDTNTKPEDDKNGLEQFFAFLLNKKTPSSGPLLRAVAIDPGHGGLDTGVVSASGVKEKELNLELAGKLAKKLKMRLGIPIYLSRDGDYEVTAEQRLQAAAHEDVDIWLLLHAQSAFGAETQGVTLFIRPEGEGRQQVAQAEGAVAPASESMQLARELAKAMNEAGIEVLGIIPSSRLSLGQGNLPTVQVEMGFMSNPGELEKLQSADYQNQLVQALYQGIQRFAQLSEE